MCQVPVAPLREAFLRSGLTATEVARAAGWVRHQADCARVARSLGLRGSQEFVTYANALVLADAIGVDPVDVRF
jgi:hypothetical protein